METQTSNRTRTRFHVKHFRTLQSVTEEILSKVIREQLTFRDLLDLRTARLYQHEYWNQTPVRFQAELEGYLRGGHHVIRAHLTDWAHWWEPEQVYIPAREFHLRKLDLWLVDPNRSANVWKGTQKTF